MSRRPLLLPMVLAALAAAVPSLAQDQALPGALADRALSVRVHAFIKGSSEQVSWQDDRTQVTVAGRPVGIKIQGEGSNLVVLVQVTPSERGGGRLTLVIQGHVWMRQPEGGLSYRARMDTVAVEFGETVIFYPLGLGSDGTAPLLVEIVVARAGGTEKPKQ